MDSIRIPFKLVDSFDNKHALMILRNLEGIQRDIEQGRRCKESLQDLFEDTATVTTSSISKANVFTLSTAKNPPPTADTDAARYAEKVTTSLLFNLPRALNTKLQTLVPKEARGRFFLEGRDITARKPVSSDADAELALSDEGGYRLYRTNPKKPPSDRIHWQALP